MISADPCTGARKTEYRSGADSPRGIDHGQSDGARVPPRWSDHRGPLVAPDESARFWQATAFGPSPAGHATFRYASLRATCVVPPQEPREKGYRGPSEASGASEEMVEGAPSLRGRYPSNNHRRAPLPPPSAVPPSPLFAGRDASEPLLICPSLTRGASSPAGEKADAYVAGCSGTPQRSVGWPARISFSASASTTKRRRCLKLYEITQADGQHCAAKILHAFGNGDGWCRPSLIRLCSSIWARCA